MHGLVMSVASKSLEAAIRRMTPVTAPERQRSRVEALSQLLDRARKPAKTRSKCQLIGPEGETIELPDPVFQILARVVEVLARGDAITVVPVGKELTTQQAANILNVSRQYLVRLLDDGRIPFTKTGKHRRLRIADVLAFKRERDEERERALTELTQMTEDELGGYPELE
jgi:excisionase family DNA binding protein